MHNDITAIEDAAEVLRAARRVVVFGCSGGGKSTFSQKLARVIGVRYVSMDREVFWLPGWTSRARSEQRQLIAQIVAENHWIIDGNNPAHSTFDCRAPIWSSGCGCHAGCAFGISSNAGSCTAERPAPTWRRVALSRCRTGNSFPMSGTSSGMTYRNLWRAFVGTVHRFRLSS